MVESGIESLTGVRSDGKKSRVPAKMDFLQSATGLFLGLFMIGHMMFISTVLISKDAMNFVAKMFEMPFIFGDNPILVTFIVAFVFIIFIIHAGVAVRKFPISYKQFKLGRTHAKLMKHKDTNLWFTQAFTGFALFFLGSIHLYIMMTHPHITADISGNRMVSDWMAPLYLLLLLAVEFHGAIGLYRLSVKWGWFDTKYGTKPARKALKKYKMYLTVFMLVLGFLSLAAYIKIGLENQKNMPAGAHAQHMVVKRFGRTACSSSSSR